MDKIVTSCGDCMFCGSDMDNETYWCFHPAIEKIRGWWPLLPELDDMTAPDTCPLKKEPLTISIKQ